MTKNFAEMLAVGGKSNSLGKVSEIIAFVLNHPSRFNELYNCLFDKDAWIRMRAADALEKICRKHPEWLLPYIDRFPGELAMSTQPSIQWHLAQIYSKVDLTAKQRAFAIQWLKQLLSVKEVDWIVATNAMDTLAQFVKDGYFAISDLIPLLKVQQHHTSKAVARHANKLLSQLSL